MESEYEGVGMENWIVQMRKGNQWVLIAYYRYMMTYNMDERVGIARFRLERCRVLKICALFENHVTAMFQRI